MVWQKQNVLKRAFFGAGGYHACGLRSVSIRMRSHHTRIHHLSRVRESRWTERASDLNNGLVGIGMAPWDAVHDGAEGPGEPTG